METVRHYPGEDSIPNSWKLKGGRYEGMRVLGIDVANRYLAFTVDELTDYYDEYEFGLNPKLVEIVFNDKLTPMFEREIFEVTEEKEKDTIVITTRKADYDCKYFFFSEPAVHVEFFTARKTDSYGGLVNILFDDFSIDDVILCEAFVEKVRGPIIISPRIWVSTNDGVEWPKSIKDFHIGMPSNYPNQSPYSIRHISWHEGIAMADIVSTFNRRKHSQVSWRLSESEDGRNGYLTVEQRHQMSGILKQVTTPLMVDHARFYDLAKSPTTKDEVSGELLLPWLGVRNLGVRLSYQNTKPPSLNGKK